MPGRWQRQAASLAIVSTGLAGRMPFIEIHAVERTTSQRQQAAVAVTEAVVRAFAVDPAAVDIYFLDRPAQSYARGGRLPVSEDGWRTFVKVHAFQRCREQRRDAARAITAALAVGFDISPDRVAVYFVQRPEDEAAHGGILASDEGA